MYIVLFHVFLPLALCRLTRAPRDTAVDVTELKVTSRQFEVDQLLYANLFVASSAFLKEQCAGSTIIHRGYGVARGGLDIHVIPHAAIFHDGVRCGTGGRNEFTLLLPWQRARSAQTAQANGLIGLYNVVKSNSRAANALGLVDAVSPVYVGVEYTRPRICGSTTFPNNSIYIFVTPTIGSTDIDFQVAYLAQGEVGMLSYRPDRELCVYKESRRLGPNQQQHITPTPSLSPFASPVKINANMFDFYNVPGVPTLFPVVSLNFERPSPRPSFSPRPASMSPPPSASPRITPSDTTTMPTSAATLGGIMTLSMSPTITTMGQATASVTASSSATPSRDNSSANTSGSVCFPSDAKVVREGWETVRISEVRISDRLLTQGGRFSAIMMSSHNDTSAWSAFVTLQTSSGFAVTLSGSHYIPTATGLQTAKHIVVGDVLTLWNGETDTVAHKGSVWKVGLHNPHTTDGTIVVDGVLTSTFTEAVPPGMANALLSPIKWLFRLGIRTDFVSRWLAKGKYDGVPHILGKFCTGAMEVKL